MYEIATFEDKVRVPPEFIGGNKAEAIKKAVAKTYENKIMKEQGSVVLAITDVKKVSGGQLFVEDAGIHYNAEFDALVFTPKLHEVIEGTVVDVTNFGLFVRFGPIDGLCHISQVTNDFITYDEKNVQLVGKDSNISVKVGDVVRARITGISLDKKEVNKINLTMRQPGLGKLEWIEEIKSGKVAKKAGKSEEKEEKAEKKESKKK